ncbi:hypothetical protein CGRA01v4_13597 [Colletotrichum graminicola]|uniref:Uncharacterized protein n=1 Tax=Colletotrichum graminicola (strain M1.001 / M2 / FGSC 10212) TaxID=645133 RepID=E3QRL7_COLGM|nr:uncharacterized protein GLRG_08784 [Colletotrichum graminicola M1.001]EFQ33505.1 hypothetical protein GLRG_08784 [Colletotrichum graminicola M1.001]WDK22307.1 hypothetical protein CGRA01v4_13597 [Colletotrichum graminicola]
MQTVPSLVGTGTAVAAAALGLVFAHPDDELSSTQSASNKRKLASDKDIPPNHPLSSPAVSLRPGTSSGAQQLPTPTEDAGYTNFPNQQFSFSNSNEPSSARPSRPLSSHFSFAPSLLHSRRASHVKQGDQAATPYIAEDPRDSVSSNGSWMRRLSLRPLSQHGSIRSSLGLDSHSVAFSHGSAAPILSPTGSIPPPLPPNKLVKRPPSSQRNDPVTRRRSKTHLPSLRRPATSHQRSATLHQIHLDVNHVEPDTDPKFSFDRCLQNAGDSAATRPKQESDSTFQKPSPSTKWTSFFHARRANVTARIAPDRLIDRSPSTRSPSATTRRLLVSNDRKHGIYLVGGGMLGNTVAPSEDVPSLVEDEAVVEDTCDDVGDTREPEEDNTPATPDDTPSKRTRISMHFNSPNWIPRAGSLRRTKRGAGSKGDGGSKRHVSAPTSMSPGRAQDDDHAAPADADDFQTPPGHQTAANLDLASAAQMSPRSSPAPLPPLSRLSSFNVDVSRIGSSGGAGPSPRSIQPSGSSQGSSAFAAYNRSAPTDRSSTLNSSDFDSRDFISGDDDTDFKSETIFDSLRTAESDRNRAVETPLDHMFDESPPGTAGHPRAKRLSIHEILGRSWDADDRIMEEDENMPTPVRVNHEPRIRTDSDIMAPRYSLERPSNEYSLGSNDFGRLSIEDDFDDDWARDEDDMDWGNQLSPPSSMNSRGVSPHLRMALASISGNGNADAAHDPSERPRSNIFDWSEPTQDKPDHSSSFRPKTAYGKQELDMRGGRTAVRKGPTAMHVRSQSVPVVHDPTDGATMNPKFGTWGLSSKTVSEDWDDDFEFDGNENEDKEAENAFAMVVPASIQASQPSLKQHTGHIRELSLLVNDLKRLCRLGRDLDMLGGSNAGVWKEAEGIIALASPDEDELEGMDVDSSSIMSGFDAVSPVPIEKEDPFDEVHELNVSKTAVIRERTAGRRRSVFSPDDDIFGGNSPILDELPPPRPKTPENNINMGGHDVTDIVRSVLDAMQQRSVSDSARDDKLHFGTNSLKALVKRAGDLRDTLSEVVRRADQITSSPARTPRQHNDSPAFTRVFTPDHTPSPSSPPKKLPHSRSTNSGLGRGSVDASPSSGLQRMQMMTVS